ncbi:MAG: hypothetical protein K2Y09_10245 [Nitrosomonas sp.]|jgi:hypothetical protein|uniref:hypothetical protein n=1 Tax=Nitrosomonas sp. TaxID=42353 RepID=UPI001D708800|nr:hypothetical protein [Nitrosomonas sp.]MBX9895546.1 hypothetical protein [Nitrosomonas sp.]
MRKHYSREDLGKGIRGKYLKDYQSGINLVLLRPEVAAAFPTTEAVNDALMGLLKVAESAGITSRSRTRAKGRTD